VESPAEQSCLFTVGSLVCGYPNASLTVTGLSHPPEQRERQSMKFQSPKETKVLRSSTIQDSNFLTNSERSEWVPVMGSSGILRCALNDGGEVADSCAKLTKARPASQKTLFCKTNPILPTANQQNPCIRLPFAPVGVLIATLGSTFEAHWRAFVLEFLPFAPAGEKT
jgi:hypothetical protein